MASSPPHNEPENLLTGGSGRIRVFTNLPSGTVSRRAPDDAPHEQNTEEERREMPVKDLSNEEKADEILDRALDLGGVEVPVEDLPKLASSTSRPFSGTARLLSGESVPSPTPLQESVLHNIVFYRNGFTVNDGPLRQFEDPENASFLESIKKQECPKELEPVDKRTTVKVSLLKKSQNYPQPFQGVGKKLGSSSSTSEAPEPIIAEPLDTAPTPATGLVVDGSLPSTTIQLRLADGSSIVGHFNYHHTIADIRSFIDASRPDAATAYQLQTAGFPPKVLSDHTQTIEQAGLANSVIFQKF